MSTTTVGAPTRAPIWPTLIAPLVTGVYYLALKGAFTRSIDAAVGATAVDNIKLGDLTAPQWGSHWIYRIVAEIISIGFGTFLAAGLARGRERAAAITGGSTIALVFLVGTAVAVYVRIYMADDYVMREPWYQFMIDGLLVIGCPLISFYVAEAARDINDNQPNGFAGINRLHFLWLWFAAYWYGLGLISPISRHYMLETTFPGMITTIFDIIINGIPAAALLIPGYFGIALLSGNQGTSLHPIARNLLGVIVLVVGFVIGAAVQILWQSLFQWLFG
jgi:hypothetical protein